MLKKGIPALLIVFSILLPNIGLAAFKANVAKVVITPEYDMWMAGYAARNKPSEGKLHDLYAKALALEDENGKKAIFVTTDLISIPAQLSQRIAEWAKEQFGISRSDLILTSSHTHSGPALRDNLKEMYGLNDKQWKLVVRYMEALEVKLKDVITQSLDELKAVQLYRGMGEADFAVNRRAYSQSGVHIGVNPIGPVDHDVPVLKVVDQNGNIMAVLFGYACHNTTLSIYKFSGDYAGFAQLYLEEQHPETTAMFFTGCGGDINPNPRREISLAKSHGRELGKAVGTVLAGSMQEVEGTFTAAFSTIDLPLTPAPSREQIEVELKSPNIYIQRRARRLLQTLEEKGSIPETYPYPLQVWRVNDFVIIAMGGEVVVDYSLLFKHTFGEDNTWVIGYANDVCAYIPSLRVLREGGYEGADSMIYYGFHGPWGEPLEDLIVKEVENLVSKTKR